MQLISKIGYSFKQGIKGVFSNKTMSFISIVSVTSVLTILGLILCVVLNINSFIQKTKDEVNEIRVSVNEELSKEESLAVKNKIEKIDGISNIKYQTKEQAFESMKESFGADKELLEGVKNPLDNYYIVTIEDSTKIKSLASEMEKIENVIEVQYYEEIVDNFLNISHTVKKFGLIVIGFLLIICLVLISNTIKTRVYSKKEEIQVIKYIGGSNRFIRIPFLIEGCIIGLFGSILSVGICTGMYNYIVESVETALSSMMANMILPFSHISYILVVVLSITGILVGVVGSGLSVKKYLKV